MTEKTDIMYVSMANVVVLAIPCIAILALCQTNWDEIRQTFVTGKFVTTSHTTLRPFSQIQCVDRCFREARNGRCSVAGYNKTAQSCHLSTDNYENIVDVADVSSGVFILQNKTTGNFILIYTHLFSIITGMFCFVLSQCIVFSLQNVVKGHWIGNQLFQN